MGWYGVIQKECHPATVIKNATDDAEETCTRTYSVAPEVKIVGNVDLTFSYIPEFLHYIIYELLKNSMRAVVERYGEETDDLPNIDVIIADGDDDIAIKGIFLIYLSS